MELIHEPTPMNKVKYFTPWVIVLSLIALAGIITLLGRFLFGLGAVTNLDLQHPWGIWIGIDVAAGVALAAGGFTTAALGHIMHRDKYETIIRPALVTALLGYTFAGTSVMIDLGRYYDIWHLFVFMNGNSVLFEVGMCVVIYLGVLYIEFLPIVTKKFIGNVRFKGIFSALNKPVDKALRILDRTLDKTMFIFIIAGVVLSCLHQSSLGTLMVIAGPKVHPLWQTPVLPLMYLISAISVGFPMVIMESTIASKSFGLKPEIDVLERLAEIVGPILGVYLAFKLGDMFIRETFYYLTEVTTASVMFSIELLFGVVLPLRLFLTKSVRKSPTGLFIASMLVIFGVALNRVNCFLVAYNPPYAVSNYFPSIGEILVTLGFISLEVLLYRLIVRYFPIISIPAVEKIAASSKYSVKGA